jgi:hypothetical protein
MLRGYKYLVVSGLLSLGTLSAVGCSSDDDANKGTSDPADYMAAVKCVRTEDPQQGEYCICESRSTALHDHQTEVGRCSNYPCCGRQPKGGGCACYSDEYLQNRQVTCDEELAVVGSDAVASCAK